MISRMSICDPEVEEWADWVNEQASGGGVHGAAAIGKQRNEQASGGVAHGDAAIGRHKVEQSNKVDVMEVY